MFHALGTLLALNAMLLGLPAPQATVTPGTAQAAPAIKAVSAPPQAAGGYTLGEDDVISITLLGFPMYSVSQATIPPDGKISLPLIDEPVDVLGKTQTELAQYLTMRWKKYIKNPNVSVTLVSKRKENVFVAGFVTKAGLADFKPPVRILSIITQVGGPMPNGDMSAVSLTHKDGRKMTLDLSHPEQKAGSDTDVFVEVGDVIYVPERRTQVSVVGEVLHPGTVDYKENMTVLDALTQVGSFNKDTADLKSATLRRDGKEIPLHLDALNGGDKSQDVRLLAGDLITVPENTRKVYVYGAVQKPGFYTYKENDRLMDAIGACGGQTQDANFSSINIIRKTADGNALTIPVDLKKALASRSKNGVNTELPKANIIVQPGDIVYVPKGKAGAKASDFFNILNPLALLAHVF